MPKLSRIFVCTPHGPADWRWLAPAFGDSPLEWRFFRREPVGWLERKIRVPDLALRRACRECVAAIAREGGDLLVTLDPRATYWCAKYAAALKLAVRHVAYGFNFATLPNGFKRRAMNRAFADVETFVVYSTFERNLYSNYFALPVEKFEVKLWGVNAPEAADHPACMPAGVDFVCAVGGNRRDYRTLMAAMKLLPDVSCVAVMRPQNSRALDVPPNVTVCTDLPLPDAMGIVRRSRFMVLPLDDEKTACGHVTMVAAMHFGKTIVVTRSAGVTDYVIDGSTGLACDPGSAAALADSIRQLWDDPSRARSLGETGRQFAARCCTERSMVDHLRGLLERYRLLEPADSATT